MRSGLLALAAAASAAPAAPLQAAAQVPHPPIALPALPARFNVPNAVIARFRADPPRCGDEVAAPVHLEEPFPLGFVEAPAGLAGASATLTFRIDARGRPLSISEPRIEGGSRVDLGDLPAALAGWRFGSRRSRSNCSVRFRVVAVRMDRADADTLYRFVSSHGYDRPPPLPLATAAFSRLMPVGSNCMPAPRALVRTLPETARLARAPGSSEFTMLAYDLDADGVPVGAHVVATSGNDGYDRLALTAIGRSRWSPGVRSGCLSYYYSFASLVADERTARGLTRSNGRNCPSEVRLRAALPPPPPSVLAAFRARPVAGWAVLRYDIGEGGAIANAEALASEPVAAFGVAAKAMAAGVHVPDAAPAAGCVATIRFPIIRRFSTLQAD